jgi:hypothetical protein
MGLNGKDDEHEERTPLERYVAEAVSEDAWFPGKRTWMHPLPPVAEAPTLAIYIMQGGYIKL